MQCAHCHGPAGDGKGWDAPFPLEDAERFVGAMASARPGTPGEWFQIAVERAGRLVGDVAVHVDGDDPRLARIGFTLAGGEQGHGYATEAVRAVLGLLFAGQFTDQRSTGAELLTGSFFHTTQFGLMSSVSYRNGILTLAYTNNGTGADLVNPWSSYPGYTNVQVEKFNRAGEQAFMVKGSYNFARFGLDGVTAYALWTHGGGAVDPSTKSPVYQLDEYDVDVQWRPKSGFLEGLWFQARYAHVDARGSAPSGFPINEIRFIVNYDFQLL